jgi:5-methylcytosine-specific restriction endonuclease McrA
MPTDNEYSGDGEIMQEVGDGSSGRLVMSGTDRDYLTTIIKRKYGQLSRNRKRAYKLGIRDGWHCHYCGKPLMPVDDNAEFVLAHFIDTEDVAGVIRYEMPGLTTSWAEVEHVTPRCVGGTNDPSNLVLSCSTCNSKKGKKSYEAFLGGAK